MRIKADATATRVLGRLLLLAQAFGCEPTDLLPRTKAKSGPKGELLDELYAVSAQLSPKQIRDLVKVARTLEGG